MTKIMNHLTFTLSSQLNKHLPVFLPKNKWLNITSTKNQNKMVYIQWYRQVSNIRRTLVGNKIVDNSDVVGASPVGAAPTTSSLST